MKIRIWWFVTLLLSALGLVMGGAHLLELPVRRGYEPEFYMEVTSTLYRYFGAVGGPVQVLALLTSIILVVVTRGRPGHRSTLLGSACLALSLLLWFLLVQPVNSAWSVALASTPAEAVQSYAELGDRWENGHLAAFAAWLLGFGLLLNAVTAEATRLDRRTT